MWLGCCCCGWSNADRCPGGIFIVVAVPIAWNATNALYEFFVVVLGLFLGLVGILLPSLVIAGAVIFVGIGLHFLALLVNVATFSVGLVCGVCGVVVVSGFGVGGDLCCLASLSVIAAVTGVVFFASVAIVVFVAWLSSAGVDGVSFVYGIFAVGVFGVVRVAGMYFLGPVSLAVAIAGAVVIVIVEGTGR